MILLMILLIYSACARVYDSTHTHTCTRAIDLVRIQAINSYSGGLRAAQGHAIIYNL